VVEGALMEGMVFVAGGDIDPMLAVDGEVIPGTRGGRVGFKAWVR